MTLALTIPINYTSISVVDHIWTSQEKVIHRFLLISNNNNNNFILCIQGLDSLPREQLES